MNAIAPRDQAKVLVDDIAADLRLALPPTISYDHFRATFITAVANNPEILTCDLQTVKTALMKAATDNLMPDNREAAIVPFWTKMKDGDGKEKSVKVAQYMPMVYGIRKRALELGGARITAECVYENDFYDSEQGDAPFIRHKRAPLGQPRGEIIGAYSIFKDEKERVLHREEMAKEDIEVARSVSKAANGPGWTKFYSEFCRKTVVRRGSKSVPSLPEKLRTIIERDDDYVSFEPDPRTRSIEHNPLVDETRHLTSSTVAPLDTAGSGGDPATASAKAQSKAKEQTSNKESPDSKPQAPRTQGSGEAGSQGGSSPASRLPAEIFHKYGSALGRMTSVDNVRKAHESFWTDYGKPAEGSLDHQLAGEILKLQNLRAEGKRDAEGLMDEIDRIIEQSFGGL